MAEEEDNNSHHSSSSPPLFMRIASSSDSEVEPAEENHNKGGDDENSSEIPDAAELIVLNDDEEPEEGEIVSDDDDLQVVYVSSFAEEENNNEGIAVDENADEDYYSPPDNPRRMARSRAELKARRRRKLLRMANNGNGDDGGGGGEKSTTTTMRGTKKRRKKVAEDEEEVVYLSSTSKKTTTTVGKKKKLTRTERKKMRKKRLYPAPYTEEWWAKRRKERKARLRAKRAAKTLLLETTTTTTTTNNNSPYNLRSGKTTTAMTTTQSYDRCLREIVQSAVDKLLVRGGGEAEKAGNAGGTTASNFVVLVAGPRNAGKSTMCRKLVNNLLCEGLTTYHLECDPGQTEFTPPGCLALTEILERVEGLPFSHLQTPLRCKFFGETSPANRVDDYVRCVRRLAEEFDQMITRSPGCLVVNTAGWIHGAGLALLREIVDATKPDYVVFLDSQQKSKLEAMSISDAAYDDLRKSTPHLCTIRRIQGWTAAAADYDLEVDQQQGHHFRPPPTNRPSAQREAALLAYFGHHRESVVGGDYCWPESESLARSILRTRPYAVSMCRVWAGVVHAQSPGQVPASRLMSVLNGSLVALCQRPQDDEEDDDQNQKRRHWMDDPTLPMRMDHDDQTSTADVECLGFGIIRGIDLESRTFYVVSPVPVETLSRVNMILKGDVGLPPAVFLTQTAACPGITAAPYVTRGRDEWLGGLAEETLDLRSLDEDKKEARRRRRKMEQRAAAIRDSTGGPNVTFASTTGSSSDAIFID